MHTLRLSIPDTIYPEIISFLKRYPTINIDTNNIKEYGIKIVMDEEKILNEGKYRLEDICRNIDDLAEFSRMKKIDKYYYVSKNDTPSDLGCFAWSNLEEQDWFIENVKEWLWLDKDDGVHNISARIIEKRELNEKIS
ncbi:MAG: hypothetical protein WC144_01515 [Sulfurimonas sp.]|jgi:hypothetical protein|nr:hypothetical protein [Sulfurimonadaceae bacterium]